jgi:hypothetical protein
MPFTRSLERGIWGVVIATAVGAFPEVIIDMQTGIPFP